jgi:hypothetical protein
MGSLAGTITTLTGPPTIDFTATGVADWRFWGLTTGTTDDHKVIGGSVANRISGLTQVGGAFTALRASIPATITWTDGSPDTTASTTIAIAINIVGRGWSFTVPASLASSVVNVYVSVSRAAGTITATLSDASATAYSDSSTTNSSSTLINKYQFTYTANSAGQTLTIQWTEITNFTSGAVQLCGVTLDHAPTSLAITQATAASSSTGIITQGLPIWTPELDMSSQLPPAFFMPDRVVPY